jgi:nucleoside-diphosphate-sugar epimerase
MLEHLNHGPRKPARVVVIGAAGFVGGTIAARLEKDGAPVSRIGRREVDLLAPEAEEKLASLIRPTDAVVCAAARAPCKDSGMLVENLAMARAMARACASAAHVVNISSDAVYADLPAPLTEQSWTAPATLHGAMHLARELVFRAEVKAPLAILRPSLLYGAADPHNGYGPNRFRRLAAEGREIVLFGEGEERRDHVYIGDLAELGARVIYRRSIGVLNVATGRVHSFREIAHKFSTRVKGSPRNAPMPHNGYRPFDIAALRSAFPDFRFTPLDEGLKHG